jgi:hypothetical protein
VKQAPFVVLIGASMPSVLAEIAEKSEKADDITKNHACPCFAEVDQKRWDKIKQLQADGIEPTIQERTGLLIDPYFSATKLAWLLEHPGVVFSREQLLDRVARPAEVVQRHRVEGAQRLEVGEAFDPFPQHSVGIGVAAKRSVRAAEAEEGAAQLVVGELAGERGLVVLNSFLLHADAVMDPCRLHRDVCVIGKLRA